MLNYNINYHQLVFHQHLSSSFRIICIQENRQTNKILLVSILTVKCSIITLVLIRPRYSFIIYVTWSIVAGSPLLQLLSIALRFMLARTAFINSRFAILPQNYSTSYGPSTVCCWCSMCLHKTVTKPWLIRQLYLNITRKYSIYKALINYYYHQNQSRINEIRPTLMKITFLRTFLDSYRLTSLWNYRILNQLSVNLF